ncbi:MAG: hypothetical protein OCD02_17370 [Spirochaetaceae bacterium]
MATITKFDIYTLKIREKGITNCFLPLNDIAGFSILDEISMYLGKNIYLFKIDENTERTSRIEKNEIIDNSIFCRIKIGKFGETSEIVDTQSGSGIFHKERKHSDTIPLFFHMNIDKTNSEAILHIERRANRTLIPELKNIVSSVLESLREDTFIFELKPQKKQSSLTTFLNNKLGYINSINLTLDSNIDSDVTENLTVNIKTKPRKLFPDSINSKILKCSENGNLKSLNNLLPKTLNNVDIIKAEVILKTENGGKINVDITEPISLSNSLIISTEMDNLDKLGHPSFNYLKEVSLKYMN